MAIRVFNISPQLPNIAARFIRQVEAKAGTSTAARGGDITNELLRTLRGEIQEKNTEITPVKNLRAHITRIAQEGAQLKGEVVNLVV